MLIPILDDNSELALYEQLYRYIRCEITENRIKKNEKLPSKRSLADNLGVSVNTVKTAYDALSEEGYIYSKERSGYYVCDIENLLNIGGSVDRTADSSSLNSDNCKNNVKERAFEYDFCITNTDTESFPAYSFRKIISDIMVGADRDWLMPTGAQGTVKLRNSIKKYLYYSRGVSTDTENIIVSSGMEYLMQILFYILPKGSVFGLENPGSMSFSDLFSQNKIDYNFLDMDESGICMEGLGDSNIVLVTPSHQFPTGRVMPVNRRIQLLNWANMDGNRYIIEDDYDSEFKYYGRPIPSLKSMDKMDNVIYIGNFSKSISPMLRVSYMVLPDRLLEDYLKVMPFANCPVSTLNQFSIARFMEEDYFERHLNRMRKVYRKRRARAIELFEREEGFKVFDRHAGLHFIVQIDTDFTEKEIEERLAENSIFVEGLSNYYSGGRLDYDKPRIIIGFAGMETSRLTRAICKLISLLKGDEV